MDQLELGATEGASWVRAEGRLPAGIDLSAFYVTDQEAIFAVTEPFGRRPMPPGSSGIEGKVIHAGSTEIQVLVTVPISGEAPKVGEQFLILLHREPAGWRFADAWVRDLCANGIDHEICA